jgi:hypothetical protein
LVYWRSYCLGVLEIVLSWSTVDLLSWCTGDCMEPGDVGGAVLSDYTMSHAARQRYSSVQYSDLIFINLRGLQFICKGKLSRGVCSSLPVDSSCLTADFQNIIQLADKQRPMAFVDWAVKLCDTNQNPLLTYSMVGRFI